MFRRVYLDNSATTPIDKEVVEAMLPFLTEKFGNASSIHFFGQEARSAVDKARHKVAEIINSRFLVKNKLRFFRCNNFSLRFTLYYSRCLGQETEDELE